MAEGGSGKKELRSHPGLKCAAQGRRQQKSELFIALISYVKSARDTISPVYGTGGGGGIWLVLDST